MSGASSDGGRGSAAPTSQEGIDAPPDLDEAKRSAWHAAFVRKVDERAKRLREGEAAMDRLSATLRRTIDVNRELKLRAEQAAGGDSGAGGAEGGSGGEVGGETGGGVAGGGSAAEVDERPARQPAAEAARADTAAYEAAAQRQADAEAAVNAANTEASKKKAAYDEAVTALSAEPLVDGRQQAKDAAFEAYKKASKKRKAAEAALQSAQAALQALPVPEQPADSLAGA